MAGGRRFGHWAMRAGGGMALGASGAEIAEELHISHETVRTHIGNAMDRLGARSRVHLVAKALGDGLALAEIGAAVRRSAC